MKVWRRVTHLSVNDRLRRFSDQLRLAAAKLRPGAEQDAFVKQARVADTGADLDERANSRGVA